jgi:uncharacterized protein (TIGR00297 family)
MSWIDRFRGLRFRENPLFLNGNLGLKSCPTFYADRKSDPPMTCFELASNSLHFTAINLEKTIVNHGRQTAPAVSCRRGRMTLNRQQHRPPLHWQSQLILLLVLPVIAAWITLQAGQAFYLREPLLWQAIGISAGFTALVFLLRAATLAAALTGGLITATLYLWTPGWRTALWPLLALFLLTFVATRFGRRRKERLGTAEGKRGRSASQVAANLGVAALASIPLTAAHVFMKVPSTGRAGLLAMSAALAEATADTLSSELGQVLGGEPRLLTTFRRVPAGTDGAISLAGTAAGCLGAALVTAVAALILRLTHSEAAIVLAAGIAGLFADSLLGATLERMGWLNNDAVNLLSTLVAALIAGYTAGA